MKILLGILAAFLAILAIVIYCALVAAGRFDARDGDEESGIVFAERHICSKCETGKKSYALDPKAEQCPYMGCRMNGECPYYVPLAQDAQEDADAYAQKHEAGQR